MQSVAEKEALDNVIVDENDRSIYKIYSFLDYMASIGGLAVALNFIGSLTLFLISLFTGNGVDSYLLAHVYKRDPEPNAKTQGGVGEKNTTLRSIERRKPFWMEMSSCMCMREDKHKRIVNKGLKRAYNELEVVRFIK